MRERNRVSKPQCWHVTTHMCQNQPNNNPSGSLGFLFCFSQFFFFTTVGICFFSTTLGCFFFSRLIRCDLVLCAIFFCNNRLFSSLRFRLNTACQTGYHQQKRCSQNEKRTHDLFRRKKPICNKSQEEGSKNGCDWSGCISVSNHAR